MRDRMFIKIDTTDFDDWIERRTDEEILEYASSGCVYCKGRGKYKEIHTELEYNNERVVLCDCSVDALRDYFDEWWGW